MAYALKVKNGDTRYEFNDKTSQYEYKNQDLVDEHETLASALYAFLEWTTDEYLEDRVSLVFTPENHKKNKKNKG